MSAVCTGGTSAGAASDLMSAAGLAFFLLLDLKDDVYRLILSLSAILDADLATFFGSIALVESTGLYGATYVLSAGGDACCPMLSAGGLGVILIAGILDGGGRSMASFEGIAANISPEKVGGLFPVLEVLDLGSLNDARGELRRVDGWRVMFLL